MIKLVFYIFMEHNIKYWNHLLLRDHSTDLDTLVWKSPPDARLGAPQCEARGQRLEGDEVCLKDAGYIFPPFFFSCS